MNKILIVDDDPSVRTLVSKFLAAKGYEVVAAENGAVGIEQAKASSPDLILMDLNMPEMDGFKATQHLKGDPDTKDVPVLVLSAESETSSRDAVYEAGCDGFVKKPIDFARLVPRIEEMLGGG